MSFKIVTTIFLFTTFVSGLLEIPCPSDITQSSLWERTHLEPCSNNEVNLFIEDPWSQNLLHACGSENRGALPSTCSDIRFRSLAIDNKNEHIYVSSTYAILRGSLAKREVSEIDDIKGVKLTAETNTQSIIGGFVVIKLYGYNLGQSRNDIKLTIKGETCGTFHHYNSTFISCIVSNPKVLLSPIRNEDISISMIGVGRPVNGVITKENANARLAAGYQQPLVYQADIIDKGFRPGAITIHPGKDVGISNGSGEKEEESRLYWYNRASNSIQSSDLNGGNMYEHASELGRIADIKIDRSGKYLFASNQHLRNIMVFDVSQRRESGGGDSMATTRPMIVAQDLYEPWGIALDEINGVLFVAESGKGRILRFEGLKGFLNKLTQLETSVEESPPKILSKSRSIVSVNAGVQLTDVALFGQGGLYEEQSNNSNNKNNSRKKITMKQSLLWNEVNGDKVKISTLYGTRIENIVSTPNQNNLNRANSLLWPRSVIGDTRKEYGHLVYVSEFLGKIWELSLIDPTHIRLIVDLSKLEDIREEEAAKAAGYKQARENDNDDSSLDRFLTAPSSSANLREFLENIWRNGDYIKGQTRTGALLRCTA